MEILPFIYLGYMFISLYFLSFYFLLYLRERKNIFSVPELKKHFSVSVLIPAYNEENVIESTVMSVLKSDYDNIVEIIVINDGSRDKTKEIVRKLMKEYSKVKLLDKKNSGKADSLNYGIKVAKGELVAVVDADSFPREDAIRKMTGFFEDEKVGAATVPILARNNRKFLEKLQSFEYVVIALTRKLLESVDAIYVTPGPLALYRKKALVEIGGFDAGNITEDIEITWHLIAEGWKRKMCLDTVVTTVVPSKFKGWWKQRRRWSMGGLQSILKYRKQFMKGGMLGYFVLPFFILSSFLGMLGLSIFFYLLANRIVNQYLLAKYSLVADTSVITLEQFYFTPSVLNYLGIVLFVMGAIFTFGILVLMKEDIFKKGNFFKILFYLLIYLMVYPFIMLSAIFKFLKKDMRW
jgi:cellulose synthase/poly-beta-1,6-N-acetylglucosamine synthase-like glycosyltransferase